MNTFNKNSIVGFLLKNNVMSTDYVELLKKVNRKTGDNILPNDVITLEKVFFKLLIRVR